MKSANTPRVSGYILTIATSAHQQNFISKMKNCIVLREKALKTGEGMKLEEIKTLRSCKPVLILGSLNNAYLKCLMVFFPQPLQRNK